MIRRPPRSTQSRSSAASDVYKRQPDSITGRPLVREGQRHRPGIARQTACSGQRGPCHMSNENESVTSEDREECLEALCRLEQAHHASTAVDLAADQDLAGRRLADGMLGMLGLRKDAAHREACKLEHVLTDTDAADLEKRMAMVTNMVNLGAVTLDQADTCLL